MYQREEWPPASMVVGIKELPSSLRKTYCCRGLESVPMIPLTAALVNQPSLSHLCRGDGPVQVGYAGLWCYILPVRIFDIRRVGGLRTFRQSLALMPACSAADPQRRGV
jgi:hypothetical protein